MKYLCIVALLAVSLYEVAEGYAFKHCKSSDDCSAKQCCVRLTPDIPYISFKLNKCKALRGEGKVCNPNDDDEGVYMFQCPCKEGLQCVEESKKSSSEDSSSSSSEEVEYRCRVPSTEAPEEKTEAPVEETEAPVEETEAPAEETEAPAEETEAPAEETEAPETEGEGAEDKHEEKPEDSDA
ncbi:uncharacterized protein LOC111625233 [Centruroides sculpturatus]|uniref:uncharacterized protein LOC111625233 n=1 Tax=Centruroides sculpturatus TaxID=218467 RepID=UPI000C6E03B2|nr:uncharacterized protein LOC111625233 [Centruroides sculpturatus]